AISRRRIAEILPSLMRASASVDAPSTDARITISPRSAQLDIALAEIASARERTNQLERTVARLQGLVIGGRVANGSSSARSSASASAPRITGSAPASASHDPLDAEEARTAPGSSSSSSSGIGGG